MSVPVVTIDGPSGSGKGTVSAAVARRLDWHFLDSGALYRLVALAALDAGLDLSDERPVAQMASSLDVVFDFRSEGEGSVQLAGQAVGERIRTEEVATRASLVAAMPEVRRSLLDRQRRFRQPPGLVADGRDMGTVVFPDAPCKVFLTASAEERARRRYQQLKGKGVDVTLPALLGEIRARDERDVNRAVAPLMPAEDAEVIDTTTMSIEKVIEHVMQHVAKRIE